MKGSSRDPGRRGVRMGITSVKQPNITGAPSSADLLNDEQIQSAVEDALSSTQFIDVHTHLFSPAFGNLGLWGIDELLTYHYLEAEFFRSSDTTPERYWNLSNCGRERRADDKRPARSGRTAGMVERRSKARAVSPGAPPGPDSLGLAATLAGIGESGLR